MKTLRHRTRFEGKFLSRAVSLEQDPERKNNKKKSEFDVEAAYLFGEEAAPRGGGNDGAPREAIPVGRAIEESPCLVEIAGEGIPSDWSVGANIRAGSRTWSADQGGGRRGRRGGRRRRKWWRRRGRRSLGRRGAAPAGEEIDGFGEVALVAEERKREEVKRRDTHIRTRIGSRKAPNQKEGNTQET